MSKQILSLNIAELIVAKEDIVVSTVLGSCISVFLFSPTKRAGGVIHYALPRRFDLKEDEPLKYGDFAIPKLIAEMENLTGTESSTFVAKLIGGANNVGSSKPHNNIGNENIYIAREILKQYGIKIIAEDVGGRVGRKALFHICTGRLQSALVGPGYSRPSAEKAISEDNLKIPIVKSNKKQIISNKKIRVLIVDDSKTIRQLLKRIFSQDSEIEVVGEAEDPIQADKLIDTLKPDVLTLDVHMPKMTGVEWLEQLLPIRPIPVVMITSLQLQEGNEVFRALELGAVDYIQKPVASELKEVSLVIREKIRAASVAKVRSSNKKKSINVFLNQSIQYKAGLIVAIGASTGGTEAVRELLLGLPASIPPTIIVQHIPPIFSKAFSDRLNSLCPFEVKEAENGDALLKDRVLIAPGGKQMKVIKNNSGFVVEINDDSPMNRHKPSVDYLFHSVANLVGKKAIGIILTGMGADGAKGLLSMRIKGARTLTQDESTCIVYGMPKVAWEIGASEEVLKLENIAKKIVEIGMHQVAA